MTRKYYLLLMLSVLAIAGCHSHSTPLNSAPQTFTTSILSDYTVDGDIEFTASSTYVITQNMIPPVQSVFAGVDPAPSGSEFRAFLDFPLGGSGGVPVDAVIDSATLEFYINSLSSNSPTVPIRIDLVSFDQSTLFPSDYDRVSLPPLLSITVQPAFSSADIGTNITLDVTSLMQEVQARGLSDFQVRILEDFVTGVYGYIEIDDSTGTDRASFAPLLTVTYH